MDAAVYLNEEELTTILSWYEDTGRENGNDQADEPVAEKLINARKVAAAGPF